MFVDKAVIQIKAGDGGDGAVSFHREKYVAAGGPDGGDGGRGGDVIFVADDSQSSLLDFRYQRKFAAEKGKNGAGKRCSGKSAPPLVVRVPRGTLVREAKTGRLLADISDDEPHVLAHGGKGGWGNQHFATPTRQIPRFAKPGQPGESYEVTLELKLLADVGLAGFPSVGKSSLIARVSAARPKIANYPFTTLTPVLGVVRLDEETTFVMADIPGLIEGASEGAGLGHEFLRHVERCRLLVHMIDVSGMEGRDPRDDFEIINRELSHFSETLAACPQIVAANKADVASEEQIESLRDFIKEKGLPFYVISAATGEGTRELMQAIGEKLSHLPPVKVYEPDPVPEAFSEEPRAFEVERDGEIYHVHAEWLEGILRTANMEDYASLQYFQRTLRASGVIDRLEAMGIQEGDTVDVGGYEFEYIR